MLQINELSNMLNQHFKWNKAKMDCFCGMQIGLIKARSINLSKIANAFPSKAESESRYRRMQRFIHDYPINFDRVTWFKWLKSEGIQFHIRVKKDAKVSNSRDEMVQAHVLFRFLKVSEQLVIRDASKITDVEVFLSAFRLDDGKLLILASSELIEQPLEAYAKRW